MDTSGDGEVQYTEFVQGPFRAAVLLEIKMAADKA
jgi:hypothetical protein